MPRCGCKTKIGRRCARQNRSGTQFCWQHQVCAKIYKSKKSTTKQQQQQKERLHKEEQIQRHKQPKEVEEKANKKETEEEKDKQEFRQFCQDRWRIEGEIGRGKFGKVSIACKTRKQGDCNYVLKAQRANSEYTNERDILLRLNSVKPQIAPFLYDFCVCEGIGYLVLEKLGDNILGHRLSSKDRDKIKALMEALHKQRIAMLDIHKGNVLRKGNQFFFTDFGLSADFNGINDEKTLRLSDFYRGRQYTWPQAESADWMTLHAYVTA